MLPRRLVYGIAHVPSTGLCVKVLIYPAHLQAKGFSWGNWPHSYGLDVQAWSNLHSALETLRAGEAVMQNHRLVCCASISLCVIMGQLFQTADGGRDLEVLTVACGSCFNNSIVESEERACVSISIILAKKNMCHCEGFLSVIALLLTDFNSIS